MTLMPNIILLVHNIRSTYNVGAIFRSAEGFGVSRIILSGYTPYPTLAQDSRLPHIREKLSSQIHKTALGAESIVPFEYQATPPIEQLRSEGYRIVGLEQTPTSTPLPSYSPPEKVALLVGEEVAGIAPELLASCDDFIEITMVGHKESFNVSVATGIALYALTTAE